MYLFTKYMERLTTTWVKASCMCSWFDASFLSASNAYKSGPRFSWQPRYSSRHEKKKAHFNVLIFYSHFKAGILLCFQNTKMAFQIQDNHFIWSSLELVICFAYVHIRMHWAPGLPDFSWYKIPKR
jgi:hypothetical protein